MDEVLCLRSGADTLVISGLLAGRMQLPDRCVVCNEDAPRHRARRTLGKWSLFAFTPVLSMAAGYEVKVEYSLCPRHLGARRAGLAAACGGFLLAAVAAGLVEGLLVAACLLVMIACAVAALRQWQDIRVLDIDAIQARIRVGEPFAQSFAERPGDPER